MLATDEQISRFFRLCTELGIDVGYRLLKKEESAASTVVRQRCYYTLDAFVKLTWSELASLRFPAYTCCMFSLMVKHSDGSQPQTKINLLKKVLNIVTSVLHNDHEVSRKRNTSISKSLSTLLAPSSCTVLPLSSFAEKRM